MLRSLKQKYLRLQTAAIAAYALAAALVLLIPCTLLLRLTALQQGLTGVLLWASVFLFLFFWKKLHRVDEVQIARYLDRKFPELEDSTALLAVQDRALTFFEKLQYQKVVTHLQHIAPRAFANPLPHALVFMFAGVGIFALSGMFSFPSFSEKNISDLPAPPEEVSLSASPQVLPPEIEKMVLQLSPPAYTGLPEVKQEKPGIRAIENTRALWQLHANAGVHKAVLLFGDTDSLVLQKKENQVFTGNRLLFNPGLYSIRLYGTDGQVTRSDFYPVEISKDQPPQLRILQPQPMTRIAYGQPTQVQLRATAADDFGLTDAQIVATVTSGAGEAVKFREVTLNFSEFIRPNTRSVSLSRQLDLAKLNMNWGDELYFYIEARDNRQPEKGKTRSEVYFVVMQDTTEQEMVASEGLGIDLVPEYFRSQRQIIIDAEKLIRVKKQISVAEFKRKSADLAFDQKSLRIRYSKFLGEEFESGLTQQSIPGEEHEAHEEGGEEHEEEHKESHHAPESHGHDHGSTDPEAKPDPLEGFVHKHDSEEEATFYARDVKFTLKDALAQMWQSELHFHLCEPEKSLPYAYKALEILKELQQKDRIYVKKAGFDPPPLKPVEKRYSGKPEDIRQQNRTVQVSNPATQVELRKGLAILERLKHSENPLSVAEKDVLEKAGRELAALSANEPGKYVAALQNLRKLISENAHCQQCVQQLEGVFWQALPVPGSNLLQKKVPQNRLSTLFFHNLTNK